MAYEQKPLTGALFKNDKGDNDKRPDYRGDCLIDGTTYKIAAWIKESAKGAKFMSLRFEPKDAPNMQDPPAGGGEYVDGTGIRRTTKPAPLDDDIPF